MAIFLGSHAVNPQNKSPFSELRCEVGEDQFPAVRRQLDAMGIERRLPVDETAGRQLLNHLIARQIGRLERLARKRKARALAEAAESTSRLAFDAGAAADKVRRYEYASIRRMTRVCDDLAELRRSGTLDDDAQQEPEMPGSAWEREPRPRAIRGATFRISLDGSHRPAASLAQAALERRKPVTTRRRGCRKRPRIAGVGAGRRRPQVRGLRLTGSTAAAGSTPATHRFCPVT